jgi:hypothetical protein
MIRSLPCLASFIAALLGAVPASAQPAQPEQLRLASGFVGASFGLSTNDAASRMRLYEEGRAYLWLVEAGFAISERVGLGVEFSRPSAATAFTTVGLGRAQISGTLTERALVGLLRGRLATVGRAAFDIVGGAGMLLQHHETGGCVPAQSRCEATDGASLDELARAFAMGLDIPTRVAAHFELAAMVRAYFLRRGEHTTISERDPNITWQNEWRSSTRTAVLFNGRVVW